MRNFILGTDWGEDCDDAVAVRLLARAHKKREIRLCGIGINTCTEYAVRALDAFLLSDGVSDVPIGIDRGATDFVENESYQKNLAKLSSKCQSNDDACDAVRLYRKILANADEPVEILEIGFLQVIVGVLQSVADDISNKNGFDLVREKVAKIWIMGGKWDEENGKEYNFAHNLHACHASSYFCENCPVPTTFLGFEVGHDVITGQNLRSTDPLHGVLRDYGAPNGRCSWDPMLALLALDGDEEKGGYDFVCGKAHVNSNTGENTFTVFDDGMHRFVKKKMSNDWYSERINRLLSE